MILVCHDCDGRWPGEAKVWRYPCIECATSFLATHGAQGHAITSRTERPSDKYRFNLF